jgi:hypothetical protein
MAREDSWAQVLRVAVPILDEARPSGMLGWVRPVAPVVTQAAVGAGHWAAGRRRRALAAWTSAAGYGLVAWGLGTEAPTPAEARENWDQNIQRLQREGVLPEPGQPGDCLREFGGLGCCVQRAGTGLAEISVGHAVPP